MYRSMVFPLSAGVSGPLEGEARDVPAFGAVYARYFRAMGRTLRRLGVEPALLDDAVQDVFVVVHRRLPEFDGRSVRGWLYAIALRVASDYRRGAAHRRTVPLAETLVDPAPDPARASELGESVRLLHELLAELDEPKRAVFVLGELEELTVPEIAEALGENPNTVYSRLRAARARFDAALRRRRGSDERRRAQWLGISGISGFKLGGALVAAGAAVWLASTEPFLRSAEPPASRRLERRAEHGENAKTPVPATSRFEAERAPRIVSARPLASVAPSARAETPKAASVREEIALLTEVRAALDRGDGAEALRRLDGHATADRQFAAERRAARILALCTLGRNDEARRALSAFLRENPGSVQRTALERSCAGEKMHGER